MSSTPPPSLKKKKSKIRDALESVTSGISPRGILCFYKKCTKEEYDAQTKREADRTMANWEAHKAFEAKEKGVQIGRKERGGKDAKAEPSGSESSERKLTQACAHLAAH